MSEQGERYRVKPAERVMRSQLFKGHELYDDGFLIGFLWVRGPTIAAALNAQAERDALLSRVEVALAEALRHGRKTEPQREWVFQGQEVLDAIRKAREKGER